MIGAGEVYTSYLQIAAVNEPLVWDNSAVATNDFFEHTAAHEVIIAFYGEEIPLFIHAGEVCRTVCCIVVKCPISRFCLDVELVAVFIKFRAGSNIKAWAKKVLGSKSQGSKSRKNELTSKGIEWYKRNVRECLQERGAKITSLSIERMVPICHLNWRDVEKKSCISPKIWHTALVVA